MDGYYLGVDIGTTFSAAAVARGGRAEIVSLDHHAASIPSLVFLLEDGSWLVGAAAGRRGLAEPGRLARQFKRRFGDTTAILLGGAPWSADALTSRLLRHVVAEAVSQQGAPPAGIVVTHPANWGPYKTDLLQQAVRSADLPGPEPRLMTEPEAAALHYAATERVETGEIVAIYDLGGGTFDAAVLSRTGDGFALLGEPEGVERLGGIDFDEAVLAHVGGFLGPALTDLDLDDPAALAAVARLRADCTAAKEALSADTEVSIPVLLPSVQTEIRLTRSEFETMIRPTLTETISALERSLRSAGVERSEVKVILLVGGSSRVPLVGQLVAAGIGRPVAVDVHPKHAVALGAAMAAAGLAPADLAVAVAAGPPVAYTGRGGTASQPPSPSGVSADAIGPGPRRATETAAPAPPEGSVTAASGSVAGRSGRSGRSGRRPRSLLLAAGLAVVVAVGIVVALLAGGSDDGDPEQAARPDVPTFDTEFYADSLASTAGTVWLGGGSSTVARFDITDERIVGAVRVGPGDGRVGVTSGGGALWVVDPATGRVSRVDPATNAVTATFDVGIGAHSAVVADGALWVTVEGDGLVVRIDLDTGTTTPVRVRGGPTYLAFGAGTLWVTDSANYNLARIDTATNAIVGDGLAGECPGRVVADGTSVWVQDACKTSMLYRLDPITGEATGTATLAGEAKGMTLAGGSLWVADSTNDTLVQIDPRSGAIGKTVRVGRHPSGVVGDGDSVWVANEDGTLSRVPSR